MPKLTKQTSSSTSRGKKKIPLLVCIAHLERMTGEQVVSLEQVALLGGYEKGSVRVMRGGLRKKGFLEWDNTKTVRLTEEGRKEARKLQKEHGCDLGGEVGQNRLSNEAAQATIMETYKLTGNKGEMYKAMLDGQNHSYESLMDAIGCSNPDSFRVFLSSLTSKKIAERVKGKHARLTDMNFPLGRLTPKAG